MKSHLIPEPQPLEKPHKPLEMARMNLPGLDTTAFIPSRSNKSAREEQRVPEQPMRNFLRVVFAC